MKNKGMGLKFSELWTALGRSVCAAVETLKTGLYDFVQLLYGSKAEGAQLKCVPQARERNMSRESSSH